MKARVEASSPGAESSFSRMFSYLRSAIISTAAKAVNTSTYSAAANPMVPSSAPPAAGEAMRSTDVSEEFMPFTLVSLSSGTSCGRIALTAGSCIPVPIDLMALTRKIMPRL